MPKRQPATSVSTMQRFNDTRSPRPQSRIAPSRALCSFAYALSPICGDAIWKRVFALRSSRMRTAFLCLLGSNSAVSSQHRWIRRQRRVSRCAPPYRCRFCDAMADGIVAAVFLTARGVKPDTNEGDIMIGAGAASVFDAATIEFASSNMCPSSAAYRSACFSGALLHFPIASSPPASALLRDMGGGAPPSCS